MAPSLVYGKLAFLKPGVYWLILTVYVKIGHPADDTIISASTAAGGKGAIAFILLFAIFYCMGWNGLAWVRRLWSPISSLTLIWCLCSEIYPTNIRGFCAAWTAVSFGILLNDDVYFDLSKFWQWVMQLLIARTTTLMSENVGWAMFLLFALFNFASVVFTILFIPETVRDYHSIGSISLICLIERENSGRNGCRVWLHQIRRGSQ